MSNELYLIVSYFVVAFVSLALGFAAYRVLRNPFTAIAAAVAGRFRSHILTRLLAASLTLAAVFGFLSVSYTERGCMSYEQVVKDRSYLVQTNQRQLKRTSDWVVSAVFVWCFVVVLCLAALRRSESAGPDQP